MSLTRWVGVGPHGGHTDAGHDHRGKAGCGHGPTRTRSSLSLLLLGSLGGTAYAGGGGGSGHHGPPGHGHGHDRGLSWSETVVDADQSFRGLDAVDRRTAWVAGGSATEGAPGRVFRTTDGGRTLGRT